MKDSLRSVLVVVLFALLAFFVVGSIHFEYLLPYHVDSFEHVISAKQIIEAKSISSFVGNDWEIGYHLLLSILFLVTGLNELQLALLFPVFSAFLMSLLTFVLVRFLTKSNLAALLSAVLALCMASNMTVLGPMFLVPMAFGIAMVPGIVWFFVHGLESKKFALLLIVLLVQQTLVHPAYAVMLVFAFFVYLLLNFRLLLRNQLKVVIAVIVLVVLLPFFAQRLGISDFSFSPENFRDISEILGQKLSWEALEAWNPKFFYSEFLGETLFVVSMLGLGIVSAFSLLAVSKGFRERFVFLFENRHVAILAVLFLSLLPLYIQFNLTDKIFLVPYPRLFMLLYYLLLVLAGIALYSLTVFFNSIVLAAGEQGSTVKIAMVAIAFFLLAFLVFQVATQPFEFKETFYRNIEPENVPAIFWLRKNLGASDIVLALPRSSSAIAAFSKARVVVKPEIRMLLDPNERLKDVLNAGKVNEFFTADCEIKGALLEELRANVVATTSRVDCGFLNMAFDKGGYSIYWLNN